VAASSIRPSRPIELIAPDMDGTLLNEDFRLTSRTREAVSKAVGAGIHFVLVSGRMRATLEPFHRELSLRTPIICYNGAMVWDVLASRLIEHTPVDAGTAREVVEIAREQELHCQYFWDDRFFAVARTPWMELYESRTHITGELVADLREFGPDRAGTKMQFIAEPPRIAEMIPALRERFGDRLYVTNTLPEYVEMMNPVVSKGNALGRLAERLGVPRGRMMVFGDAQNDETMFEVAGYPVAVANAPAHVQERALLVAPRNDEDGVARCLEGLGIVA